MVNEKHLTKKDFLNDLYLFYRLFIVSNYHDSVPAPHIKKLSRKLMDLHNGTGKHRLAVSMPPRHLVEDHTPILTSNRGWTTHGDLHTGDKVFGADGKPTEILKLSPKEYCDMKVTISNGAEIIVHKDHLWSVYQRGKEDKGLQTLTTEELSKNFLTNDKNQKRYTYHLPLIEALTYSEKDLPIDPYWLGLWLGDGTSTKPCITHSKEDNQFIKHVPYTVSATTVHNITGVHTTYFSHNDLLKKIKDLDLYKNKHIPRIYKEASFKQRLQLLAGLIDSDGCVDKTGRVRFINTNKQLIDDVYELCTGLGLYPYIMKFNSDKINEYQKKSSNKILSKKDCYHIGFRPRYDIPTHIPRKKITGEGLRRRLAITNIEKINDGGMGRCIEIENDDGIYLIGKDLTPTHNSKSSMVTLAFPLWLLFQNPNVNIMIVTGSPKLAEKFGIQLREYVRDLGKYFNVYLSQVKQASTHIMFCDKNNKLYKGNIMLASSGGGITGQDADYLILDDPYTGNDEEFTPSALQKKIDWINRVVEQRIEPHTKYCVLHTRWHPCKWDTPVLTANRGWVNHIDLKIGDEVFTPNGETTKVVKVHPPVKVDNCFEFSNGDKIVTGDHHLWNVYDWGNRKQRLMETQEIMKRKTLVGKKKPRSNFLVEKNEPLQYPHQEVPIDPYWLGLWLGDGHHKRPSITCDKKDMISTQSTPYEVVRYDDGNGECVEAFYTHQDLTHKLKELEVYGNKHIPYIYLHNSLEVRLQLLAGLIDSDGSVEKSSNRVVFVNTNKVLIKQVYELLNGLGFSVHIEKRPMEVMNNYKKHNNPLNITSNKDAYALRFYPHIEIPTKVHRKRITGEGIKKRVGLINTYKVEEDWGNCITVEAEDGMYLVGRNLTPTHNSHDIIGYYKENDPQSYDFVEFPAIKDDGTPLWKERYTLDELLKKKEIVGDRVFESVYQQKPIDTTSDFFNMPMLKYGYPVDYDEQHTTRCRAWDIASSDALTRNDFTAGIYMIRFEDYAIITDLVHGRFGNNTNRVVLSTAETDTPSVKIVIETGVASAGKLLFNEWCNQLVGYMVSRAEVSGGKSKVDRATPLKNAIEDGKVYVAIEDPVVRQVFYDELSSFPNGEHDDITDATAHAFNELFIGSLGKKRPRAKLGVVFL